jgi:hypothetical protein
MGPRAARGPRTYLNPNQTSNHLLKSKSSSQTLKAFESRLFAGWTWRKEEPVRIPDYDEREPDVAIIRGDDSVITSIGSPQPLASRSRSRSPARH